ncbi:MAG: hypothetical protein II811_00025 [Spirochaetaceae bacterium]|nr:hypothetical protein [Spirochaetaceae bacterium]
MAKMVKKLTFLIFAFLCFSQSLCAEMFRVHKTHILGTGEDDIVLAGINDCISIILPEDISYLNGIELQIKIPRIITEWPYSIVYGVYNNVSPAPQETVIDYRGEKINGGIVPNRLSWAVQIPTRQGVKFRESPYTAVIPVIASTDSGALFFRFQLAMKGVPQEFDTSYFSVSAKPIFAEVGKLTLSLTAPDNTKVQPYTVFVDGIQVKEKEDGITLATGIHSVSLVSDFYRNEVRTVTIEQAKVTNLEITFRDITPEIRISAPENATVFLDGEKISEWDSVLRVSQGDHLLRFIIGDYEIIRTVKAENGRSYTVTLGIDASVTEDTEPAN